MTNNNPDQDELDPSLEDGAEDFGYEEESFGDDEFGDDAWDEALDDSGNDVVVDSQNTLPAKKKGGLFNIILIAVAVLGGGAFIYLKVLSPSGGSQPSSPAIAEAPSEVPQEMQQAELPVSPPAPMPLTPDPVNSAVPMMPAAEQAAVADSLLPTLAPELVNIPLPESSSALADSTSPEIVPILPVVMPETQQPVELVSAPPMPAPIVTSAVPEVGIGAAFSGDENFNPGLPSAKDIMLTQPDGLSADVAKGIEQKLSVLLARLDTLEGRITNLETGLHQVSSKVTAWESKPVADTDLGTVNKTLQALERKISTLENTAPATPAVSVDITKVDKPIFIPAAPETVPETGVPTPETAATVNKPKKAPPAPISLPQVEPARNASWVLRSAQPGAAMVVPKAGGDMRTVRVGDNLAGLGRIIAIEQRGSRWVVQGTQSTLTH